MKQIALRNSTKLAMLDDADAEQIGGLAWKMSKDRNGNAYAVARVGSKYKSMHRLVMGEPQRPNHIVDHIDGDGLNNQRSNLRICNQSQNMGNAKKHSDAGVKFKGVTFDKQYNKYRASICVDGQKVRIGRFATAEDAAFAYDKYASLCFGEFARLNFPDRKPKI